jgi:ferredoxin-NADP reductase
MYVVVHILLAVLLIPLLTAKILIARRYKHFHSLLVPLGLAILQISFVLVAIPVLSLALRSINPGGIGLWLTFVLAIVMCLFLCRLAVRRPQEQRNAIADLSHTPSPAIAGAQFTDTQEVEGKPMTLLLAHIEQQTHDTKTLRFLVPAERRLQAKPGQFLTFHWFVNGKRVLRSYTISSSPTHTGYVEITPKRIENGCVSTFLNDQATLGLAVEATGPHGKFYFDELVHRSIVLIAAGSGITPMISILRYIDDLHLPTPVTLLYCVRTEKDIVFRAEIERLRTSLPNLNYGVCLSQPDDTWRGHRGHLTREFICQHVPDLEAPTFFLCGPRGFMQNARQILTSVGVAESRITEESFGETRGSRESSQAVARAVDTVDFAHSQRTCTGVAGCTLLELAEANGVQIPFGCRQGQCGTCATRLLRGSVHMDTEIGLTAEQKNAGYVLPCVSRPEGSVVLAA